MDPNQFYMPSPPYPGGPVPTFGPVFDGRNSHNTTTNPYLNTLFAQSNALKDMTFGYAQMAQDPNLTWANQFVNPAVNNAYQIYQGAQQEAQGAQSHASDGSHGAPGGEQKSGPDLGGGLKGAAGGAVAGAVAGSFIPIIGTGIGAAIGAVIGGLVGLFG